MTRPGRADDILKGMRVLLFTCLLLGWLVAAWPSAHATEIELIQRPEVVVAQQRMVGNVRAQARREGIIRQVPQLFVYHTDFSPAFHLDGHQSGFTRNIELVVDRFRRARSVIGLDTLLERAKTTDGQPITLSELPPSDVVLVVYRSRQCETCDRVIADLEQWLEDRDDLEPLWLIISIDRRT